ncbi:MAG: oligosaccharide flippase family protein [Myxococcota bacterium]|nr:oligosaccharide flippase family protein [Myxococcales bacterium]
MSRSDDELRPGDATEPGAAGALGRRFLIGTVLLGAGNTAVSVVNLVVGVLLARWLGPEEFGLFAFVLAITEVLSLFGGFSFGVALIQAREESQRLYDTAFAVYAALGAAMIATGAAIAAVLFAVRGREEAVFLVVLVGARWFRLTAQVPRAKLERTLRYDLVTRTSVLATGLPNVVALGVAWMGVGAWALVIRDVLVSVLTYLLESLASGYRFRRDVGRDAYAQLMGFAKPVFLARVIDLLVERVDRVAVGAFLGNASAGLLDRARFLADVGLYVMRPVERASLNLLSRVQDDARRSARSYELVTYFLVRLMFAGSIVLVLAPVETLRLVLGDEWTGAAPALRWLGLHGAVFPVFTMTKVLVLARNEGARLARISAVQAAILIPGTIAAAWLDQLAAVAAVVACTTCVGTAFMLRWTRDLAAMSYRAVFAVPLAAALVTAAAALGSDALGGADWIAWYARPFAIGATFVVVLLAAEGRRLASELGYLRAQLAQGRAA